MNGSEHSGELQDGTLAAAAAIALAVTSLLLITRFQDDWSSFVQLLVTGVPALAVLSYALPVPVPDGRPPVWLSALYAAGFALSAFALITLADLLGASDDLSSGTITWVGGLLTAGWASLAVARGSGLSALLAAIAAVVTFIAFVDFAFDPEGTPTFRYLLVVSAAVLFVGALVLQGSRPGHATALADVAGLAALALGVTFAADLVFATAFSDEETASVGAAWGWELVLMLIGAGLCAFAMVNRVAGPGWIGALVLAVFAFLSAVSDNSADPSFVGWPLVLVLLSAGLCAGAVQRR
jgi:hypothetical protein